jgi:DNA-binding response OmpR family regulator
MISQRNHSQDSTAGAIVLCIDDDEMTLAVMRLILETNGFSIRTATNWNCAMDAFRKNPIDLVLLDYEMPDMNGHEVAALIRRLKPEVPIILHSDSSNIPEIANKLTDAVIPKGIDPRVLIASISNLIMRSRTSRSSFYPRSA